MLYFIQVITYTGLMSLVYLLFLRSNVTYRFNRVYLLLSAILPLVLPFIQLPQQFAPDASQSLVGMRLPEVLISQSDKSAAAPALNWMMILYVSGVVIALTLLVMQLLQIRKAMSQGERHVTKEHTLLLNSGFGPGSWFNYIFMPGSEQQEVVIKHEQAHISLHHSYDILLLRILQVVCWPNLFLQLIKSELKQVHEYQADAAVAGDDKQAYAQLLVGNLFNTCTLPLSHSFIVHPIKRRIIMLGKKQSTPSRIVYTTLSAATALIVLGNIIWLQSCKSKQWDVKNETTQTVNNSDEAGTPPEPINRLASKTDKYARFNGDMAGYMASNIHYPDDAKKDGIEGRIAVKFVVDEQGNVQVPEVNGEKYWYLKSGKDIPKETVSSSLRDEALKAVSNMPAWIPAEYKGEKVAIELTLPVMFKLN